MGAKKYTLLFQSLPAGRQAVVPLQQLNFSSGIACIITKN